MSPCPELPGGCTPVKGARSAWRSQRSPFTGVRHNEFSGHGLRDASRGGAVASRGQPGLLLLPSVAAHPQRVFRNRRRPEVTAAIAESGEDRSRVRIFESGLLHLIQYTTPGEVQVNSTDRVAPPVRSALSDRAERDPQVGVRSTPALSHARVFSARAWGAERAPLLHFMVFYKRSGRGSRGDVGGQGAPAPRVGAGGGLTHEHWRSELRPFPCCRPQRVRNAPVRPCLWSLSPCMTTIAPCRSELRITLTCLLLCRLSLRRWSCGGIPYCAASSS